jgi:plasmid stabilization system protein ParE
VARKIRWSNSAWLDLEEIADFIAKDSRFYAAAVVREIRDASRGLLKFAKRGRIVPELDDPAIREIFIREFRLIYKISPNYIDILALIHFSRNLSALWSKRIQD